MIAVVLLLAACGHDADPAPATATATDPATATATATPTDPAAFEAIVRVTGGASDRATLPMVVAVHGLGDSPEAFSELFDGFMTEARVVVPRAPEPYHGGFGWFPFRTSSEEIGRRADQLAASIRAWRAQYPTRGTPVLTGFSQGAMLAFAVALRHPDVIAASFPVSGRVPADLIPSQPRGGRMPRIRAMHGTEDDLLPIAPMRAAVEQIRARGFVCDPLIEVQGVGHTITPFMQQDLHRWIAEAIAP